MKRITASEARKNWFRVLDEVVAGETVVIERKGQRVVLAIERAEPVGSGEATLDYDDVLAAPDVENADTWTWEWDADTGALNAAESDTEEGHVGADTA